MNWLRRSTKANGLGIKAYRAVHVLVNTEKEIRF